MDLNALASLGEFIAGMGVIVSLLYLSVQVRQNTTWVRASTYQTFSNSTGAILEPVYTNPELFEFFRKALRFPETLSEAERLRWHLIATRVVRQMEATYYQHVSGTLEHDWWAGLETSWKQWMSEPGLALWLKDNRHRVAPAVARWLEVEIPGASREAT